MTTNFITWQLCLDFEITQLHAPSPTSQAQYTPFTFMLTVMCLNV